MSDSERIEQLRALLNAVVENTKREMNGKPVKTGNEAKLTTALLGTMLGRRPTLAEVELAQHY